MSKPRVMTRAQLIANTDAAVKRAGETVDRLRKEANAATEAAKKTKGKSSTPRRASFARQVRVTRAMAKEAKLRAELSRMKRKDALARKDAKQAAELEKEALRYEKDAARLTAAADDTQAKVDAPAGTFRQRRSERRAERKRLKAQLKAMNESTIERLRLLEQPELPKAMQQEVMRRRVEQGKKALGKGGAYAGGDALDALEGRKGKFADRHRMDIHDAAVRAAAKARRRDVISQAELLSVARRATEATATRYVSRKFQITRDKATDAVMANMQKMARAGDLGHFVLLTRLLEGYVKDDIKYGNGATPGRALVIFKTRHAEVQRLHTQALRKAVPRLISEARQLLSGELGTKNGDAAEPRLLAAHRALTELAARPGALPQWRSDRYANQVRRLLKKAKKHKESAIPHRDNLALRMFKYWWRMDALRPQFKPSLLDEQGEAMAGAIQGRDIEAVRRMVASGQLDPSALNMAADDRLPGAGIRASSNLPAPSLPAPTGNAAAPAAVQAPPAAGN